MLKFSSRLVYFLKLLMSTNLLSIRMIDKREKENFR